MDSTNYLYHNEERAGLGVGPAAPHYLVIRLSISYIVRNVLFPSVLHPSGCDLYRLSIHKTSASHFIEHSRLTLGA